MHYFIYLVLFLVTACDSSPQSIALGTLERDRIVHTAIATEVVVAPPVPQGSLVQKGTVLVKLDDTLQQAQVRKAEAEVAQAKANLEKLRNGARAEEVAVAREKEPQYRFKSCSTILLVDSIAEAVYTSLHAARGSTYEKTTRNSWPTIVCHHALSFVCFSAGRGSDFQ